MAVHREPHSKTASDSSIYMDCIVGTDWNARAWHTDVFSTIPTHKPITSENAQDPNGTRWGDATCQAQPVIISVATSHNISNNMSDVVTGCRCPQ